MEKFDENQMDEALDRLLKRATDPSIPEGAETRLMAAIRATEQQTNVVKFQPRPRIQRWAVGIPLAASLVLGIYLGAKGTFDNYMPNSIIGDTLADTTDSEPTSGLDDAESYAEGDLT
jgi:hypothetical protein